MMTVSNVEQILEMQMDNYQNRIGTTFGIFKIDDIRYNWQAHTQEWTISCTKCGHSETVTKSVGWDWLRGKGRSRDRCKYCKQQEVDAKKIEKNKKEHEEKERLDGFVGNEINGWLLTERNMRMFVAVCKECGFKKNVPLKQVENNSIPFCMHKNDFSDHDYIGRRYGNLVITGYANGRFKAKCDCGFEKQFNCSAVVNGKSMTCGRLECEYHIARCHMDGKRGTLIVQRGEKSEIEIYEYLKNLGYTVKKTPRAGDFGVDIMCKTKNGDMVAIQVKNNASTKSKADVKAVQEVYAGGIYYGCNKFAVVSYTGYTDNAKKMADKLGVYLCDEKCELYKDEEHFHANTKHIWIVNGKVEPMSVTFKRNGWDFRQLYKLTGMPYEQVEQYFDRLKQKRKNIKQRKECGVSQQKISYRMKHMGMTFEQAISTPNVIMGRPKKQEKNA